MWFSASVHAHDVLDQVYVTARVWGDGGVGERQMVEQSSCATTVDGVGEDDARQWLKDALVALIEVL